ncbi:MAG: 3'-5' exonuclease [Stenomitos rutilans HA7619-LM2]|jgi:DNA polymerase-3 subunit epsilon|nr:3'-5' exonuclease [Stenomitos rutilans HA7619-LM2]
MSDRQVASQWAQDLLSRDNWCILDTETTGLGNDAEICQIAVIDHEGKTLFDSLIEPTVAIEPGAIAIHGITNAHVEGAGGFHMHLTPLLQVVRNREFVIYNAEFDLKLLRQSARPYGIWLAFPTSDRRQCRLFTNGGSIHCAMHWYSQWVGEWNDYHGNYKWQRLPGGDHSALGDCKATLDVIRRMAEG